MLNLEQQFRTTDSGYEQKLSESNINSRKFPPRTLIGGMPDNSQVVLDWSQLTCGDNVLEKAMSVDKAWMAMPWKSTAVALPESKWGSHVEQIGLLIRTLRRLRDG